MTNVISKLVRRLEVLPSYSADEFAADGVELEPDTGAQHEPEIRMVLMSERTRDLIVQLLKSIETVETK